MGRRVRKIISCCARHLLRSRTGGCAPAAQRAVGGGRRALGQTTKCLLVHVCGWLKIALKLGVNCASPLSLAHTPLHVRSDSCHT